MEGTNLCVALCTPVDLWGKKQRGDLAVPPARHGQASVHQGSFPSQSQHVARCHPSLRVQHRRGLFGDSCWPCSLLAAPSHGRTPLHAPSTAPPSPYPSTALQPWGEAESVLHCRSEEQAGIIPFRAHPTRVNCGAVQSVRGRWVRGRRVLTALQAAFLQVVPALTCAAASPARTAQLCLGTHTPPVPSPPTAPAPGSPGQARPCCGLRSTCAAALGHLVVGGQA